MVKTMFIPNTIGIPTHRVDLWHHGLRLAKRNSKLPMEPSQGERGRGRKREEKGRGSGVSWRASHVEWTGVTGSHHVRRHDFGGMAWATWQILSHGGA